MLVDEAKFAKAGVDEDQAAKPVALPPTTDPPPSLAPIAALARAARGDPAELSRLLNLTSVPMLTVDGERRYVDANRPARLLFRLSLEELRKRRIDDLTAPEDLAMMEAAWDELVTKGSVAGPYRVAFEDGSRLEVVYWALAYALKARHLIAFAPAKWSEGELDPTDGGDPNGPSVDLTRRELEVLRLAAQGYSAPRIARLLVIGESTVKTHLANVYAKLGVSDRAAAVATSIRLGLID